MQDEEIVRLQAENVELKKQLIQLQRAYLLQQRELNAVLMERLDSQEKSLSPEA